MRNSYAVFRFVFLFLLFSITKTSKADFYPDQYYVIHGADSILFYAESVNNLTLSSDGKSLILNENESNGFIVLNPVTFDHFFNRGLPSWNGSAPGSQSSSFNVEMRFFVNNNWSSWVTVGFWDKHVWSSYGETDFIGGYVDIDYVKLNTYINTFQFKVSFKRINSSYESPKLKQLSFTASDTKIPISIPEIVNDNPGEIFIPTDFICQYDVDDDIGGSICSPTTVSMIIRSFDIEVDPLRFAERNKDPYWGIFGVWPRVVTHASEYGLRGAVTRYRTWSEAAQVLQNGGRIAMSVGLPLYSGHLFMLAGFTEEGTPIVHDPAKSNGYSYIYNKQSLSESWFNKGGISYTFYLEDSTVNILDLNSQKIDLSIYPNPVSDNARFEFHLESKQNVSLKIYDINGRCISTLVNSTLEKGEHTINWTIADHELQTGFYVAHLNTEKISVKEKILICIH